MRKKYLRADEQLAAVSDKLSFDLVNPEASMRMQRKFIKKPFEPEFTYQDMPNTEAIREELASIKIGKYSGIAQLLARQHALLFDKIRLIESIGTTDFGEACEAVYGKPSKALLKKAYDLLEVAPENAPDRRIKRKEVMSLLHETFKRLGFRYKIRGRDMVASAMFKSETKTLYLRKKERFSKYFVYRLCVHEIATHALRAQNGSEQDLLLFKRGTPGYLVTEEGLAAYNEERAGVMSADTLRKYAGRVVAVDFARAHTFVETYEHLVKWFEKKEAFKLTLRAKRGVPHGSVKGACTKDHVYLKGYYQVKEYAASGGRIDLLHQAKISCAEVEDLSRYLEGPQFIPEPVIEWIRLKMLTE